MVDWGAEADCEGRCCGGDAKGDLFLSELVRPFRSATFGLPIKMEKKTYQICERVKLLAHQTALLAPPRDLAIKEVEEQAQWH